MLKRVIAKTVIFFLFLLIAAATVLLPWWGGLAIWFVLFQAARIWAIRYYRTVRDELDLRTQAGQRAKDSLNRKIDFLNGYYRRVFKRAG